MNSYNNNNIKLEDDEDDVPATRQEQGITFCQHTLPVRLSRFFIDEGITKPSYYRPLIETLLSANQNDKIELWISTPGGRLDSLNSIVNAINSTDATVQGILMHDAFSAGGMLFLSCHDWIVMPGSAMMIHGAVGGVGGPMHENRNQMDFDVKRLERIFKSYYKGFLTDKEIKEVLEGRTMWLDEDEISDRLHKKVKYLEKEAKSSMKNMS